MHVSTKMLLKSFKILFMNTHIFRHLKLEIASAIPALNEWKIVTNDSAWQGLKG